MALSQYNRFANDLADGLHDFVQDTMNLVLMTNTHEYAASDSTYSDLDNEISGAAVGYTTGGLTADGGSASTGDNTCEITYNDESITQSGSGFTTARKYAFLNATGSPTSGWPLITYGAANADFGNQAGDLTIDYPANFLRITV